MSTPPYFSDTLTLARVEDQLWQGEADPRFSNGGGEAKFVGQFGGWVTAALLKGALGAAPPAHRPRALNVTFLDRVRPGALSVQVTPLRVARSVSFWKAALLQGESLRAEAVLTAGEGRDDPYTRLYTPRPAGPGPETPGLAAFSPPTPFGRALEARWLEGTPFQDNGEARSLFWSRIAEPTRLDTTALALLSDFMPPRVLFAAKNFVPSTTLSLNLYFQGSPEEIDAVGDGFVMVEVRGRRIADGYWDHTSSFWNADGALLATSEQVALHRG